MDGIRERRERERYKRHRYIKGLINMLFRGVNRLIVGVTVRPENGGL